MGGGANAHGELIDDPVEDEMQADGDPSSVSVAQEPLNVKSQEYRGVARHGAWARALRGR